MYSLPQREIPMRPVGPEQKGQRDVRCFQGATCQVFARVECVGGKDEAEGAAQMRGRFLVDIPGLQPIELLLVRGSLATAGDCNGRQGASC